MPRTNSRPTWNDVKASLAGFGRAELLHLVQDLYAASKENQAFLHARFELGGDVLAPYKKTIVRWLAPDPFSKHQDISVSRAKQAVSDYKKAVGQTEAVLELMVFYCEVAADYCADLGMQDEAYFNGLVRMFEQAVQIAGDLPEGRRGPWLARLEAICHTSHQFGYDVGDDMDHLLAEHGLEKDTQRLGATG